MATTPIKIYCIDIERDENRDFIYSEVFEKEVSKTKFNKFFPNKDRIIAVSKLPRQSKMVAIARSYESIKSFYFGLEISDSLYSVWEEMYNEAIEKHYA